jgi:hypothetical protein
MRLPLGRSVEWGANATWPLAQLVVSDGQITVELRGSIQRALLGKWFRPFQAQLSTVRVEPILGVFGGNGVLLTAQDGRRVVFNCFRRRDRVRVLEAVAGRAAHVGIGVSP